MAIRDLLLPEFDQEMANTRKLLERVPEDDFAFRPHPKSMALGRLAGHVAELPGWVVPIAQSQMLELDPGTYKPYTPQSVKELLESFDNKVREARAALAGVTDEQFGVAWTLKFGGKTIFTLPRVAAYRAMVMSHMIHHRAQLGVYLRVTEVEIPGMYGPSADDVKR